MHKLNVDFTVYETELTKKYLSRKKFIPKSTKVITAFIPGVIKEIFVKTGQTIKRGDKLLVLEAMKMMNEVSSTDDGKVVSIKINIDDRVVKDQILIELE